MRKIYFIAVLCLLVSCGVRFTAKKQAQKMAKAINNNDYEITLKYTHPAVVKMAGGNKEFIEVLKKGNDEMIQMENKNESIKIGRPSKIVKAGNEIHCLLSETIYMILKENKMTAKSYFLAVSSDKGKNWTFIETALLNEDNIYTILPNYNKALVIPKREAPKYFK